MSRLHTRITQMERRVGRCPDCRPTVALVQQGDTTQVRASRCPSCGEPVEQITVLVAFDPRGQ
jgi:uncharacterized protein with PIN domain